MFTELVDAPAPTRTDHPDPPMSLPLASSRRQRDKAAVRERLLEAARDLLAEHGVEGVTLRAVADRLGYTAPAIYAHFGDKQGLMRAIMMDDFARLGRSFAALAGTPDPVERIEKIGRAYIRHAVDHPRAFELLMMTRRDPEFYEAKAGLRNDDPAQNAYAILLSAVKEAIAAGRSVDPQADAHLLAQTLWAGVHGVSTLAITKCDDPSMQWTSLKARTDCMTRALIDGLFKPAPAAGAPCPVQKVLNLFKPSGKQPARRGGAK